MSVSKNVPLHSLHKLPDIWDVGEMLVQLIAIAALLAICAGNSQRPVVRSFDVFFDLRLNKRLSKQCWGWRFETLSRPLWRHCNVYKLIIAMTEADYG